MSTFQTKFDLSQTAVSLFEQSGDLPTVSDVCYPNKLGVLEFYDHFASREQAIRFFLASLPLQYAEMTRELDGYQDLEPGEKISTMVLSSLDMLDEIPNVAHHYFQDLVSAGSLLHENAANIIAEELAADRFIPGINHFFLTKPAHALLAGMYVYLLNFALYHDNASRQKTFALTEKLTSFFNAIITNATISSGLDVVRFMIQNKIIDVPFSQSISRFLNGNKHE